MRFSPLFKPFLSINQVRVAMIEKITSCSSILPSFYYSRLPCIVHRSQAERWHLAAVRTASRFPRHPQFIWINSAEPSECNVSDIREVYANWKADAYSLYVTVWGVEAPLTPTVLNKLLWTVNRHSDVLTGIYISSLYQDIGHNLCGAQSIAKWI
uniref:Uncharacterized protein n=1 Tax=Solanum lycopersicum TaxID=4081 RepID=A0A3Q7JDD8_SOLLC